MTVERSVSTIIETNLSDDFVALGYKSIPNYITPSTVNILVVDNAPGKKE
jgi:hypothetical protein